MLMEFKARASGVKMRAPHPGTRLLEEKGLTQTIAWCYTIVDCGNDW